LLTQTAPQAPGTQQNGVRARLCEHARAVLPYVVIFVVVTLSALPMLQSGEKILLNRDFFLFASQHEAVRKSLVEYHTLPLRSHWLGGGYPTIADPEDPTFNPLVLLSVVFGAVKGLKLIGYIALLIGGLATYALARNVLGYTRWGALFSGLVYGTCLFVPLRVIDGNPNEVYAAFLPLCLLLLGLTCRGRKSAVVILPFVFFTMLSDGKLNCLMAMFYIGVVCLVSMVPSLNALSPTGEGSSGRRVNYRPLKFFLLALGLTALIGMVRILPAEELLHNHGGASAMLPGHPKTYQPTGIPAYTVEQLWQEPIGWNRRSGLTTVGLLPVVLTGIALIAFWRNTLAWGVGLVVFCWLILAHHAPFDLLKLSWKLPVFEALYRPYKYFSFQIAFTLAIVSGRCFCLLRQLHSRWVEALVALVLIGFAVGFLYPKAEEIQRKTFTQVPPVLDSAPAEGFFQIDGKGLVRARSNPPRALAYFNLRRNIGTIDWYTAIPLPEHAVPKYFVDAKNNYTTNEAYRGEAFFEESDNAGAIPEPPTIRPNSISVPVDVKVPGVLIINQNHHRDWHADHGTVLDRNGLLAVKLEEPGSYTIHLRYHPRAFYAGLTVTLASLSGVIWVCWAFTTGRLERWSLDASPAGRNVSRAILWLVR
jgi:hypothetical protein